MTRAELPRSTCDDACSLVFGVRLAAHGYGSSAVQVATYLSRLLSVLGYRGVIRTGPTELLFAIDDEGGRWQRLYLAEREGGSLDLDKLARLGELVRRPVTIVVIPAVILLVSGSIGFQGLATIAAGQTVAGVEQFLQMFLVALLIVAGSLVGNTLVGNTLVRPTVTL